MFTGIVEAKGQVVKLEPRGGDLHLCIYSDELDFSDVQIGDSLATNGVCLTVVSLLEDNDQITGYAADVSLETLSLTTVGRWQEGDEVNIEKALTPQTRLGGHMVSGHVDGIAEVLRMQLDARAWRFTLKAPDSLAKYIAHKGSITVDGTSLTINAVNGSEFELAIVPHTMDKTTIANYSPGTKVNIEVDLIARYLERLLLGDKAAEKN
ncbi:MAG: riboflavin synthase [Cellvibrionaceae bacterium]|jgi:riboflavin synthase